MALELKNLLRSIVDSPDDNAANSFQKILKGIETNSISYEDVVRESYGDSPPVQADAKTVVWYLAGVANAQLAARCVPWRKVNTGLDARLGVVQQEALGFAKQAVSVIPEEYGVLRTRLEKMAGCALTSDTMQSIQWERYLDMNKEHRAAIEASREGQGEQPARKLDTTRALDNPEDFLAQRAEEIRLENLARVARLAKATGVQPGKPRGGRRGAKVRDKTL